MQNLKLIRNSKIYKVKNTRTTLQHIFISSFKKRFGSSSFKLNTITPYLIRIWNTFYSGSYIVTYISLTPISNIDFHRNFSGISGVCEMVESRPWRNCTFVGNVLEAAVPVKLCMFVFGVVDNLA